MKLRLPGVAFEDAITTLTALAALAQPALPPKSVRVYLDPLAVLLGGVEPFLQWALAPDGGRPSRILLAKGKHPLLCDKYPSQPLRLAEQGDASASARALNCAPPRDPRPTTTLGLGGARALRRRGRLHG